MPLLTWHGTLVCLHDAGGGIVHLGLPLPADAPPPMELGDGAAVDGSVLQHPRLGPLTVQATGEGGGVTIARYGRFLNASPGTPAMAFDRKAADRWEAFLPIAPHDLALLQHVLRQRWIVRHSRAVLSRAEVRLAQGFVLHLAGEAIALGGGLASTLLGPAEAGDAAPQAVRVPRADGPLELVLAGPRSSALLDTDRWPVRARRQAELMVLAAHRGVLRHEPEQAAFERDTRTLLDNGGAAGLQDLLERVAPHGPAAGPAPLVASSRSLLTGLELAEEPEPPPMAAPAAQDLVRSWALRQMAPWLMDRARLADAMGGIEQLARTRRWAALYRFEDGAVSLEPRPDGMAFSPMHADRAQHYLRFLAEAARLLPHDLRTSICLGLADTLPQDFPFPVFAFQKAEGADSLLLPDIDFLAQGFYEDRRYDDAVPFSGKAHRAVFAGSTTGGLITPDVLASLSLPRLRAAHAFSGHDRVDFRLPKVVQVSTPAVRALLEAQPYCQTPELTWQEQLGSRFIISMDGNGATCSRVAVALHSHAVLLKYASPHMLYYFQGLQPWVHYVPIAEDRDVETVLAMADADPALFERVAENGRAFARAMLSRDQAVRYTAALLALYAGAFGDVPAAPRPAPPPALGPAALPGPVRRSDGTHMLAHIQDQGDRFTGPDGWTGQPGSTRAIEGFAVFLDTALPAGGIACQAVLADGSLSAPVPIGSYVGTRGENAPIYGLRLTIEAEAAAALDIACEAHFVDGSSRGPVPAGTTCQGPAGAALEAVRLVVAPR